MGAMPWPFAYDICDIVNDHSRSLLFQAVFFSSLIVNALHVSCLQSPLSPKKEFARSRFSAFYSTLGSMRMN
jgi:hypothetical protein